MGPHNTLCKMMGVKVSKILVCQKDTQFLQSSHKHTIITSFMSFMRTWWSEKCWLKWTLISHNLIFRGHTDQECPTSNVFVTHMTNGHMHDHLSKSSTPRIAKRRHFLNERKVRTSISVSVSNNRYSTVLKLASHDGMWPACDNRIRVAMAVFLSSNLTTKMSKRVRKTP